MPCFATVQTGETSPLEPQLFQRDDCYGPTPLAVASVLLGPEQQTDSRPQRGSPRAPQAARHCTLLTGVAVPYRGLTQPFPRSAGGRDGHRDSSAACAPPRPDLGLAPRVGAAGRRGPRHHLHQPLPQVRAQPGRRAERRRTPRAAPHPRVRCREEEAAYLRAREHRPAPPTTEPPPPAPAAAPPAGRELSLLAAQLRALADSLWPAAAPAWPEAEALPPDSALARLLGDPPERAWPGDAPEGAWHPAAHAHWVPCPPQ